MCNVNGLNVLNSMRALAFHQCGPGSILGSGPASYVGWVCWFSTLLQDVFLQVVQFSPLPKIQHLIWYHFISFDLIWFDCGWFHLVSAISRVAELN